jgi:hypothetical protein
VEATVLEKTLSRTKLVQSFIRRARHRKVRFQRSKWTLLRINQISVDTPLGQTSDRAGLEKL